MAGSASTDGESVSWMPIRVGLRLTSLGQKSLIAIRYGYLVAFDGSHTIQLKESIGGNRVRPYNPGDTVTITIEKDGVSTNYVKTD